MQNTPVQSALDQLAVSYSTLDALPLRGVSKKDLALAAEDAEFYGREILSLARRLREAARSVSLQVVV